MAAPILSIEAARRASQQPSKYLLWVRQADAKQFAEPGWVKLEPPRDGAVLFLHRQRELRVVRASGVL